TCDRLQSDLGERNTNVRTNLLKHGIETPSDKKHFVPKAQRIYAALGRQSRFHRNAQRRRSAHRVDSTVTHRGGARP
ncbi:hypothetical protein AVEN_147231-1, partial [Araneus ventricosus]